MQLSTVLTKVLELIIVKSLLDGHFYPLKDPSNSCFFSLLVYFQTNLHHKVKVVFLHSLFFDKSLFVSQQKLVNGSYHLLARYITTYFKCKCVKIPFHMLFAKEKMSFARGSPSNTIAQCSNDIRYFVITLLLFQFWNSLNFTSFHRK